MATIGGNSAYPTMLDMAKRHDPDGSHSRVIEMLQRVNPVLEDAPVLVGNLPTGHRATLRTGLPSGKWRKYNEGIAATKSTTSQFDETCGMLEDFSKIDVALAEMYGDPAAYRASEDDAFVMGMSNTLEDAIFYESTKATPEAIMGLVPRMNTISTGANKEQIVNAAGSGNDCTSIWLIGWGLNTVSLLVPKGQTTGLQHKDLGEQLIQDSSGNLMRAFVTHWKWNVGVCVQDKRYLVRVANVDMGAEVGSGDTIVPFMIDALAKLQDTRLCKPVFYVSRSLEALLRKQARSALKGGPSLSIETIAGQPVAHVDGVPVRRCDALLNTESAIS